MLELNKIYNMDVRDGLKMLDTESIDCVITSPPYWSLRDYGIAPSIWDADPDCNHEFEIREIIEKKGSGSMHGRIASEQGIDCKTNDAFNYISKRKEGFCSKCGAWKGCLGLEPNFELYTKHLCDIYDQIKRVLKKSGTCWVNLGDTHGGSGNASGHTSETKNLSRKTSKYNPSQGNQKYTRKYAKCLLMIPQRFAIEMINRGWILRNVIIWHKPNCMPSSAKDRFTVDFEYVYFFVKSNKNQYWINQKTGDLLSHEPLGIHGLNNIDWEFRMTKNKKRGIYPIPFYQGESFLGLYKHNFWKGKKYWFEQQREPHLESSIKRACRARTSEKLDANIYSTSYKSKYVGYDDIKGKLERGELRSTHRLGKNKRTVWKISTKGNSEAHFAIFPPKLVQPMIKSGCPEFVCVKCGKPREKIIETVRPDDYKPSEWDKKHGKGTGGKSFSRNRPLSNIFDVALRSKQVMKGYSDCGCNTSFTSGVVLDPFAGTGTTLKEAWKLGRNYIGFELSKEYCEIANRFLKPTKNKRLDEYI